MPCRVFGAWIAQPAYGGASCEERKIGAEEIRKAMQLGYRTRQIAEGAGASVALVGRVGSDVSEYGLRYTHIGALVRDHPKGRWIFVHVLNECGSSRSDVYNEGLANFYLDDPHDYEGVVVVPSPQYQRRLAELAEALLGPSARALHEPSYNMIAHPRSEKYQNSNQWLLELMAAAHAPQGSISTRAQAQAYLAQRGFTGDPIRIPALKRLGARFFSANVRLEEHEQKGSYGVYETVTVRSVIRFLDRIDNVVLRRVVRPDGPDREPVRY
ncbi:MAG: DUF2145 domain-containing protein [Betaproteobacteria bacterium]|nr:DUF2145 domain-containing protein [Betaproteobacteria bacterium]